jgi:hypothetical protein
MVGYGPSAVARAPYFCGGRRSDWGARGGAVRWAMSFWCRNARMRRIRSDATVACARQALRTGLVLGATAGGFVALALLSSPAHAGQDEALSRAVPATAAGSSESGPASVLPMVDPAIEEVVSEAAKAAAPAAERVAETAAPVVTKAVEAARPASDPAAEIAGRVAARAAGEAEPVVHKTAEAVRPVAEQAAEAATPTTDAVAQATEPVVREVLPLAGRVVSAAAQTVDGVAGAATPVTGPVTDAVAPAVDTVAQSGTVLAPAAATVGSLLASAEPLTTVAVDAALASPRALIQPVTDGLAEPLAPAAGSVGVLQPAVVDEGQDVASAADAREPLTTAVTAPQAPAVEAPAAGIAPLDPGAVMRVAPAWVDAQLVPGPGLVPAGVQAPGRDGSPAGPVWPSPWRVPPVLAPASPAGAPGGGDGPGAVVADTLSLPDALRASGLGNVLTLPAQEFVDGLIVPV